MIPTRGITSVSNVDIAFAEEAGYKIKLLGSANRDEDKVYGNVEPVLLPASHPLASVNNEFNAVFVNGNAVDELMFYGRGAGPLPTGSAVLGDIIGIAKKIGKDSAYDNVPQLRYDSGLEFAGEGSSKYYVRMAVPEKSGILGKITTIFGEYDISIEVIRQEADSVQGDEQLVSLIVILFNTEKEKLQKALDKILQTDAVHSIENIMRVESR